MINMHGVEIESKIDQLMDINRQIFETAQKGAELIRSGASPSRIDVESDFLRTLFRRRETILCELKKQGITERELYARKAAMECTG